MLLQWLLLLQLQPLGNQNTLYSPDSPGQLGILIDNETIDVPVMLISQGFQNFEKRKIPTFMDLDASDTMFVSRNAFTKYELTVPCARDFAKAIDGKPKIIGEGNVVQYHQVNGKE